MRILTVTLASACALAFAVPASAQFSDTVGTDYTVTDFSKGGGNANLWNIDGEGLGTFSQFNIQGNFSYKSISTNHVNATNWNGTGSAFWADDMFRAGATLNYDGFDLDGVGTVHFTNYGGFGEWFAGMFTLGAKGGGFTVSANAFGDSGSTTGGYVGGEAVAYVIPDLALSGTVDYASINGGHETDFTPQAEWLFMEKLPITLYTGYTYSNLGGSGFSVSANTFFVGFRFYLNENDATTLMDRQRTGVVRWGTSFSPLNGLL